MCERLQISEQELREDISVLNVVNFGGGAYVIYAEVQGDEIEVDPEPYSDTFDRPARLLPIEANALIAAINFLGDHLSEHLVTARQKIEAALGEIGQEGLLVGALGRRRLRRRARRRRRDRVAQPDRARVLRAQRGPLLQARRSSRTRSSTGARAGTSPPTTRRRRTRATSASTA